MTARRITLIAVNLVFCFMLAVVQTGLGDDLMTTTGSPEDYAWADLFQRSGYFDSNDETAPEQIDEGEAAASADIQVIGILINGDRRLAIVLADGKDALQRVSEGDRVQGRRITRIGPRSIEVDEAGGHRQLLLDPPRRRP